MDRDDTVIRSINVSSSLTKIGSKPDVLTLLKERYDHEVCVGLCTLD